MLTTAADLTRNLIAAWWQPVLMVAAVVIVALVVWALLTLPLAVAVGRAFKAGADGLTIDDLMDGDDWADLNGYPRAGLERLLGALDETAETFEWLPVETPEHRTPIAEAVDFAMWQREVEAG